MKSEIAELNENFEEERETFTSDAQELKADKKRLIDDLQAKNEQLASALDELEKQTVKNQEWTSRIPEIKNRMDTYAAQVRDLEAALAAERVGKQELEAAMKRLTEEKEAEIKILKEEYGEEMAKKEHEWQENRAMAVDDRIEKLEMELAESQKVSMGAGGW